MKTITVVYAIGVFCQEESDWSLLADKKSPAPFCGIA